MDIKPIEGTPFALVREGEKYFLVMGDHKISPDYETEQEVLKYRVENLWLIIANMITIIVRKHQAYEQAIKESTYETESL